MACWDDNAGDPSCNQNNPVTKSRQLSRTHYPDDYLYDPEYSAWRLLRESAKCAACHVTHDGYMDNGRIPDNSQLDYELVGYYRSLDPLADIVHAYAFFQVGLLGSTAISTPNSEIIPNRPNYPNTSLPRSFTLSNPDYEFYVTESGTKHMSELLSQGPAGNTSLATNMVLGSFDEAVGNSVSSGFQYGVPLVSGNWELIISASRGPGMLPAIVHAVLFP